MSDRVDLTPNDPRAPEEIMHARAQPEPEEPTAGEPGDLYGPEPVVGPPPLDEADVTRWLERVGRVAAWALPSPEGLEPPAWRFTTEELADLTPPLTRVVNRRLMWLAGVIRNADEIEVGFLLLEYVSGNLERVRDARAREEATEEELDQRADLEPGDPGRGPHTFGLDADEN